MRLFTLDIASTNLVTVGYNSQQPEIKFRIKN